MLQRKRQEDIETTFDKIFIACVSCWQQSGRHPPEDQHCLLVSLRRPLILHGVSVRTGPTDLAELIPELSPASHSNDVVLRSSLIVFGIQYGTTTGEPWPICKGDGVYMYLFRLENDQPTQASEQVVLQHFLQVCTGALVFLSPE